MNPAHLPRPALVQTQLRKLIGKKKAAAAATFALLLLFIVALARFTRTPSVPTVQFPFSSEADTTGARSTSREGTDVGSGSSGLLPPRRDSTSELRIFVGVMTMAGKYEVRHLHRLVNALQKKELPAGVRIDVMFIFCRLISGEQRGMVSAEILHFDDILILNCPHENMDNGKTYRFFSALARIFKDSYSTTVTPGGGIGKQRLPPYDYVLKADDDTYLRLPSLAASLLPLPREDLYYGFQVDAGYFLKGDPPFMAGMAYALSWDLVEWVARWDPSRRTALGFEDRMVGKWLLEAGKGKNVYDTKPPWEYWGSGISFPIKPDKFFQYDMPRPPAKFLPHTVSVHRVKEYADWARVLDHFNVTASVKPSRFYDIKLNFGRAA